MTSTKKMPRAQLSIESLEDRLALSVTSSSLSAGVFTMWSDNNASNVTVTRSGANTILRDTTNGFYRSLTGVTKVQFVGGSANDRFVNYVSTLPVAAWGMGGNDYLEGYNASDTLVGGAGDDTLVGYGGDDYMWGEAGNDILRGMDGNDRLYGGDGDDDLYGMGGYDYLYGENGNDFMDSGSAGEYLNGGAGYDFNAYVTAIYGAQRDDVHQGGGPTCWLLASLSAVAVNTNLANRITYLGSGNYRVTLYNAQGQTRYQYVNFTGERNNADPNFNPNQEGESWVVIMQRAVLQELNISITNPPGGNPVNVFPLLTGRASNWFGPPSSTTGFVPNAQAEQIMSALAQGRHVAMCTWANSSDLATDRLVAWHCYNIVSVTRQVVWHGFLPSYQYTVTVRNPWGFDGGNATGNTSDALITLNWSDFARSISGFAVS